MHNTRMTDTERNQLARRIVFLYHKVLVDIRNWLFENNIDIARDAADCLELIALDYFHRWHFEDRETIEKEIHNAINSFVSRHHSRYNYFEIFDLSYNDFIAKYLPIADSYYHECSDFSTNE